MKKLIIILAILSVNSAFADVKYNSRKRCMRGISWRYKVEVTLVGKHMSSGNSKDDKGCSSAEAECFAIDNVPLNWVDPSGIFSNLGGTQQKGFLKAKNTNGSRQETRGYNTKLFDAGYDSRSIISKYYSLCKKNTIVPSFGSFDVSSEVGFVDTLNTNNDIHFGGMNGYLLIPNNDPNLRYTYEVIIWQADSELDEEILSNKILMQSSFTFTDGFGYQSYGDLFNQGYTVSQTDSGKLLELDNVLDSTMSFGTGENIVITVRMHYDDINNGQQSSLIKDKNPENTTNSYLKEKVGFNKFEVIPSSDNVVKINYERNTNNSIQESKYIIIENIGIDGKVITKKIKYDLPIGNQLQSIIIPKNDLSLKTGINFLKITYGNETFVYRVFSIY